MLNPELSPSIPNPNHPKLGDTIKVEPIRTVNAINKIKKALAPSPRNFAIFVVGINTAYRASELLSIRLGPVSYTHLTLPTMRLRCRSRGSPDE